MITAAMREAAYQALVKLGVPIPPEEIDAVLEAAEGARMTNERPPIMTERNHLTLKWGSLKAWEFHSERAKELLRQYDEIGASPSAALQHDTPEQKALIVQLIDEVDDPKGVYLDWDGKYVSKAEAKDYVLNYSRTSK